MAKKRLELFQRKDEKHMTRSNIFSLKKSQIAIFLCVIYFMDGYSWLDVFTGTSTLRKLMKLIVLLILLLETISDLRDREWMITKTIHAVPALVFFTLPFLLSISRAGDLWQTVLANILELWIIVLGINTITNKASLSSITNMSLLAAKFDIILLGILYVFMPGVSMSAGSFIGFFTTKNPCSALLAFSILLFIYEMRNRVLITNIIFTGAAVYLLIQCKAVIGGACVILSALLYFLVNKKKMRIGYVYLFSNAGFIIVVQYVLPALSKLFDLLGRDITLTGRTNIWNALISVVIDNNLYTGFGYDIIWDKSSEGYHYISDAYSRMLYGVPVGAHNNWLEIVLNIGIIGLIFFILFIVNTYNKADILGDNADIAVLILCFVTIYGLTERMSMVGDYKGFYLVLCAFYIIKEQIHKSETVRNAERRNE